MNLKSHKINDSIFFNAYFNPQEQWAKIRSETLNQIIKLLSDKRYYGKSYITQYIEEQMPLLIENIVRNQVGNKIYEITKNIFENH